jgi:hypothetical protein
MHLEHHRIQVGHLERPQVHLKQIHGADLDQVHNNNLEDLVQIPILKRINLLDSVVSVIHRIRLLQRQTHLLDLVKNLRQLDLVDLVLEQLEDLEQIRQQQDWVHLVIRQTHLDRREPD